jgi:tetratricopeptide (TPR) repeat protein
VILPFNISAAEFFELIRPAVLVVSAVISTLVFASARKRFPLYLSFFWALGILVFPLIVLPLYFVSLLLRRRQAEAIADYGHSRQSPSRVKSLFALPLLYGVIVLSAIGVYFYRDSRTVDAHLARAVQARLYENRAKTISEYQKALALEDNPHTHKLLAIEFADNGNLTEASSEFRLAELGGEPDDSIYFRFGQVLEKSNRQEEARSEFEKFLKTKSCAQDPDDPRCSEVRARLEVKK